MNHFEYKFKLQPPRQREISCINCKKVFKSSLLVIAYCPYCRSKNILPSGFSPTR